jgi:hypothetical protein
MLKSLQHKRFTTVSAGRQMRNEQLLLSGCYWYVQAKRSIALIGIENDSQYKRPWDIQV